MTSFCRYFLFSYWYVGSRCLFCLRTEKRVTKRMTSTPPLSVLQTISNTINSMIKSQTADSVIKVSTFHAYSKGQQHELQSSRNMTFPQHFHQITGLVTKWLLKVVKNQMWISTVWKLWKPYFSFVIDNAILFYDKLIIDSNRLFSSSR